MNQVRVELHNFAEVLEEFSHLHLDEMRQGVVSGIARSVPDLVKASPVDTGLYAQSWAFTSDEMSATLGNTAPHAPIIELGTRPGHLAPIKPLLEWAKRVTGDPSQPPNYSPAVWKLARYTQKKIYEQGIQPRHVLQNALPGIIDNIRQELAKI